MQESKPMKHARRKRGFERASSLVQTRVREASETRGFAVTRLLTHWDDIVGADLAGQAKPVNVSYGRGFGATLTLLVSGAVAPLIEMQKDKIRDRVNACYGYAAIARIKITQTSATGFAEPSGGFKHAPTERPVSAEAQSEAKAQAKGVRDIELRDALEKLGANVLSQT